MPAQGLVREGTVQRQTSSRATHAQGPTKRQRRRRRYRGMVVPLMCATHVACARNRTEGVRRMSRAGRTSAQRHKH